MRTSLTKHLANKSIVLQNFLSKKRKKDWRGKPTSWPDIRKKTQDGHIYLLVDTRYPIGFIATATDGYSVAIDGEHYADYANNSQFAIADWADYTDTEGYDISEPTGATKAHIIDIYPTTEGNDITVFRCKRTAGSSREYQGVLWAHFNIINSINLQNAFGDYNTNEQSNEIMLACTAKNNKILLRKNLISALNSTFAGCSALNYLPIIDGDNGIYNLYRSFRNCINLSKINLKNLNAQASSSTIQVFADCMSLEKLPKINLTNTTRMDDYITNDIALKDTVLDVQDVNNLTKIGCYGTSQYFMSGFKGLRVSNEAPFNHATPPQINISYTGMDRQALVTLFNDLPTVSNGQIINITGCTGTAELTADDKAIATAKGWTITL